MPIGWNKYLANGYLKKKPGTCAGRYGVISSMIKEN